MAPIIYQCYELILFVVSPHVAQRITFNGTYNAVWNTLLHESSSDNQNQQSSVLQLTIYPQLCLNQTSKSHLPIHFSLGHNHRSMNKHKGVVCCFLEKYPSIITAAAAENCSFLHVSSCTEWLAYHVAIKCYHLHLTTSSGEPTWQHINDVSVKCHMTVIIIIFHSNIGTNSS